MGITDMEFASNFIAFFSLDGKFWFNVDEIGISSWLSIYIFYEIKKFVNYFY